MADTKEKASNTLFDALVCLHKYWKWFAATTAAGLALGAAYVLLAPEKYEASASIQMAMVANEPVELPAALAEKLKLPTYYSPPVYEACGMAGASNPGETLANMLRPTANRFAPLVSVRFVAPSEQSAEGCLTAVLKHVRDDHAALAKPNIAYRISYMAALKERLEDAEKLRSDLNARATSQGRDAKTETGTLFSALTGTAQETRQLLAEISKLELALSPSQTKDAIFSTPVYIKETRPLERRITIAAVLTLFGLFVGISTVLARNAWLKARQMLAAARSAAQ